MTTMFSTPLDEKTLDPLSLPQADYFYEHDTVIVKVVCTHNKQTGANTTFWCNCENMIDVQRVTSDYSRSEYRLDWFQQK